MSRNDQVMRQWFILRMLERPGGATIDEIVASLPGDYACHSRTIRRDLEALSVCFPLFTESVDRRVRWKLMEGFGHVPALRFSATELMAMVFTSDLARPLAGTPIKESLDSALLKMRGALPVTADGTVPGRMVSAAPGTHKSYRSTATRSSSWRAPSRRSGRWRCATSLPPATPLAPQGRSLPHPLRRRRLT